MTVPYSSPSPPSIGELNNVQLNNNTLANNDVVKYDATTKIWRNAVDSASGGTANDIVITDTNNNAIFYPTFVDNAGVAQDLRCDRGLTPWSINPNTGKFDFVNTLKLGVAIGDGRVAVGAEAGAALQGAEATAVGLNAGNEAQQKWAVAVGSGAGQVEQQTQCVAVGYQAGNRSQVSGAVAVGAGSGFSRQQKNAVGVGSLAGNDRQGSAAVAIGASAGTSLQGRNSIAIGSGAGALGQPDGQICLNASGLAFTGANAFGCYVNPIRRVDNGSGVGNLSYNPLTFEITYSNT